MNSEQFRQLWIDEFGKDKIEEFETNIKEEKLEALQDVSIEDEARYYAKKAINFYKIEKNRERMKLGKLPNNVYKMLEFRRSRIKMVHIQENDLDELIDLALSIKDYQWVKKLQEQKNLMRG